MSTKETDNTATAEVTAPNPLTDLLAFVKGEIARLESRGKKPKTLIELLPLLEPLKEANNHRVRTLKSIRDFISEKIKTAKKEGKEPSKNLLAVRELLARYADINHNTVHRLANEIVEAMQEAKELRSENEVLKTAIANEPTKNVVRVVRHKSQLLANVEKGFDDVTVSSNPDDVISRVLPIIHCEDGVVGFAVVFNQEIRHYTYFHRVASELEVSRGNVLDIDGNTDDALLVYQMSLNLAFRYADAIAEMFGPFNHITHISEMLETVEVRGEQVGDSSSDAGDGNTESEDSEDNEDEDEDEDDDDEGGSDNDPLPGTDDEADDDAEGLIEDDED